MAFEMKDVSGLGGPLTKLIEVVSSGIGTLYRPRQIRNEADAEAYRIRALHAAEQGINSNRNNNQTAIAPASTNQNIPAHISPEEDGLRDRAKARLLKQEIEGQINIEQIVDHAAAELPNVVSNDPVSADWRRNFFRLAENICAADLQLLWGKVLAGEVASPGAFSIRTLEVLQGLSKQEAEIFQRACALAFSDGFLLRPGLDINYSLDIFGLTYNDLMALRDAGLIMEGDTLSRIYKRPDGFNTQDPLRLFLMSNGLRLLLTIPANIDKITLESIPFSTAGREIQKLIRCQPNLEYLKAVANFIQLKGAKLTMARTVNSTNCVQVEAYDVEIK